MESTVTMETATQTGAGDRGCYLQIRGLSKRFGTETVLSDVSLDIEEGKILAILGPSGCGKSTTLRIIAGLLQQDKGEIWMGTRRLDDIPANKRNIGYVFQNYSLFPHMTVWKNIEFGLKLRKADPVGSKRRVSSLLAMIGLEGMEEKRLPSSLVGSSRGLHWRGHWP